MKSFVINPKGENKAKRLAPLQQKIYISAWCITFVKLWKLHYSIK